MNSTIGRYLFSIFLFFSCSAPPENRPPIQNAEFDQKLTRILPFKTPLVGVDSLAKVKDQFLLLDARPKEEYKVGYIPGAKHIGYPNLKLELLAEYPEDTPIVVYCSVGYRSDMVGRTLQKKGFKKVYNLYGSIFEWVNQGYPIIDEQGDTTRRLHTYNRSWSKWVEDTTIEKVWK